MRYVPVRSDIEGVNFLDRAIAGYKVVNEVGSTADMAQFPRNESVSTRGYDDDDHKSSTQARIDAIERNMSFVVNSLKEMRLTSVL